MRTVPQVLFTRRLGTWLLTGVVVLIALSACISEDDLTAEQRAHKLDQEFMCPICDGQTLDQSHAQLAQDMKVVIREKIAAGESNQQIRDYFVDRYGEVVLAAPEASGFGLIVWVMPAIITIGGALAVFWVLKNMRRRSAESSGKTSGPTLADRQLAQYLDKVDSDIGYRQQSAQRTDSRESGNL